MHPKILRASCGRAECFLKKSSLRVYQKKSEKNRVTRWDGESNLHLVFYECLKAVNPEDFKIACILGGSDEQGLKQRYCIIYLLYFVLIPF